jgi:hypothetical protein
MAKIQISEAIAGRRIKGSKATAIRIRIRGLFIRAV